MTEERKLPQSRLSRLTQLARVGARTGASLLLGSDGGQAAAQQAAEVLGSLRGLAAKVGQMASYVDGMVPDSHRDAYQTALRGLRAAAPTSSPQQIRQLVENELGAPIDRLFVEWDDVPFASASIGQVHRARLPENAAPSGLEVAVKVQHPGIAIAVENDLQNAAVLRQFVEALGPRNLNSQRAFAEIQQRFREELDYRLEAERQQFFASLHAGDPDIDIPQVISERSAARVLTSVLKKGASLDEAAMASEDVRRHYAEVLWRFVFRGNLVGGLFNADPHPGNYLFQDQGRIVFLDFGCIQPIPPGNLDLARTAHCAALARDETWFAEAARRLLQTKGGPFEVDSLAYTRRCFEPIFRERYQITRDYVKSLVEGVMAMKQHILARDSGFVPLPEGILFMNRLQFGFYSVLAQLSVEVSYREVEHEILSAAGLLRTARPS
ncbi:MAG: AarF/ABC1/UbiB kinase family protein [Myxococcales bacterium]|nr:AarF/ABC1/UbiB kinase family protein [Myxococcales bacterium]